MIKISELVDKIGVERKSVFISLQNEYKSLSEKMVQILNTLEIPNWCMYDGTGNNTNKGGDNYHDVINKNIHQTCIFVSIVSQNYIKSEEVAKEICGILTEAGHPTNPKIVIFPIFVDKTTFEEFAIFVKKSVENYPDIMKSKNASKIVQDLSDHSIINNTLKEDMSNLEAICDQIKDQYIKAIFENVSTKIDLIRNSNIFTDFLNYCIKQKCESNFVSDDIKNTSEISGGVEAHILTNEIKYYDTNTYSLVVISSNLLGDDIGAPIYFDPQNKGSKYFYYVTKEFEDQYINFVEQLRKFVKKDRDSRMRVSGLIRREFCFKNKVIMFLDNFNDKSIDEICDYVNADNETKASLRDLYKIDSNRAFVSYMGEKLSIPESIKKWLRGQTSDNRDLISLFIKFLDSLSKLFEQDRNINKEFCSEFQKYIFNLKALKRFDDWQFNPEDNKIPVYESQQLVRHLLNTNLLPMPNKEYPRIESWLRFNYDENGKVVEIDDSIVEKALANCTHIIVSDYSKNNKLIKLCYSFSVFVDEQGISGAWYTTGSRYNGPKVFADAYSDDKKEKWFDDLSTLVTTYMIDSHNDEAYKQLLSAFAYLVNITPNAKKVLEEKGSRLKKFLPNYETGVK